MSNPDRQAKSSIHRSEQNVQNNSFDEVYKVMAFEALGEYNNDLYRLQVNADGSLAASPKDAIERYDYSDPTTIYVGTAAPGTAASATSWTIYKYNLSDTSDASALRATNTAWTDRTTGSYA